jgi:hypothetical protein
LCETVGLFSLQLVLGSPTTFVWNGAEFCSLFQFTGTSGIDVGREELGYNLCDSIETRMQECCVARSRRICTTGYTMQHDDETQNDDDKKIALWRLLRSKEQTKSTLNGTQ